jgi:hypothetical protein
MNRHQKPRYAYSDVSQTKTHHHGIGITSTIAFEEDKQSKITYLGAHSLALA